MITRRAFVGTLAGGLLGVPLAAEALGVTIPQALLLRADEVIR